ncbi:splicing factor 3A subunit 3-like [Dendronephthya gigantea]|uniref:splicing factor 3A subunit 3-like n=1 Tax=Dendronephthya gigantea TaxID=151771 RepID=UPI00106939B8|nr:splicing factor 3A subunit 3-like [Dendronephthya gigantea]
METIIERQRRQHEECERLENAMTEEILWKKQTQKEQINSDHRGRELLERYLSCSDSLLTLYEDKDGMRKEEVSALSGPNEFAEFYSRLRLIKDYHRKYPNEVAEPMQMEFVKMKENRENPSEDMQNLVDFSDEEGYGKYLDLHEAYDKYINIKGIEKQDYLTYLETFDRLFDIPKEKKTHEYKRYIIFLLDYLYDYCQRVQPLLDIEKEMKETEEEFENNWSQGSFPGWPKDTGSALAQSGAHLDLSGFSSAEELASLGLDRLKQALQALNLKCGGTLEERAQRLFYTKGKSSDDFEPSLFAKSKGSKGRENVVKQKEIAALESQVYRLVEVVGEQRASTRDNVVRKQARTTDELEDEEGHEEYNESDSEDEETVLYNPKNLPLGWDGKPIPYWLYKLHGLNISYSCEICGNMKYRGPKAFQRHFAEWRHAHNMRCLGIPNTAHFANVTQITDALALWEKLKVVKAKERWLPDVEEEFEDSSGNVVNRKTFEDLSRQGLL